MEQYDIIIIGAGIIGSMVARYLSGYELDILMIEKEIDVGMCPSSANSAIIHAGYDPEPGSLKAKLNVEGNRLWENLAGELDIPFKRTGSYVVSFGQEEFKKLQNLYEKGVNNGVPMMKILKRNEFLNKEPIINPGVSGALWTPTAGVIDPFGAVLAAAENAVMNDVKINFNTKFEDFIFDGSRITGIRTNLTDYASKWVINCAGLYSDDVMHKANLRPEFKITPRKGEYLIFDASKFSLNNILFPVPTEKGKGILVSTTVHGNVMIGPNAMEIDNKSDPSTTTEGLNEIIEGARKLVPSLNIRDVIAMYSGIRARGNADRDFVIEIPKNIEGFINLGGIESPGFASAPAIAVMVINLLAESGFSMKPKSKWNPLRRTKPSFHKLSHKEKAELIKKNPSYGRIVCRCEEIMEGEIIDAIHSLVPARTYDGIKRRTWLGTGRCQGAFDTPRVIDILSNELGIPVSDVTKKGKGSEIVFRGTKDPAL